LTWKTVLEKYVVPAHGVETFAFLPMALAVGRDSSNSPLNISFPRADSSGS
jgi:hypothetical protein